METLLTLSILFLDPIFGPWIGVGANGRMRLGLIVVVARMSSAGGLWLF
jgi:hypothetical protein